MSRRRVVVRSFSSLHRELALQADEGPRFGERDNRADDDVPPALPETDPLRGPVFGDIVHRVLVARPSPSGRFRES